MVKASLWLYWLLIIVLSLLRNHSTTLIDQGSIVSRAIAHSYFLQGDSLLFSDPLTSIAMYKKCFAWYPTAIAAERLSMLFELLGDHAHHSYWRELHLSRLNPIIVRFIDLGIVAHYTGDYDEAISLYKSALSLDANYTEALYHLGVSYQHVGSVQLSADCYHAAIAVSPMHIKSILNYAALHHRYGSIDDGIEYYAMGVRLFETLHNSSHRQWLDVQQEQCTFPYLHHSHVMLESNLAVALLQKDNLTEAYYTIVRLMDKLQLIIQVLESTEGDREGFNSRKDFSDSSGVCVDAGTAASIRSHHYDLLESKLSLWTAAGTLHKVQAEALHWKGWELLVDRLVKYSLDSIAMRRSTSATAGAAVSVDHSYKGSLLPFDTLLIAMPMDLRLLIAQEVSASYHKWTSPFRALSDATEMMDDSAALRQSTRRLRLGFISYDFNDHPTAHLVIALFETIGRGGCVIDSRGPLCGVELVTFSYGKDDNSSYRRTLERLSSAFIDISDASFDAAASIVRQCAIDVLLDLQIHTLGSRLEITASGVAPLVVNYLVYPGTSGAPFYDYIAVDRIVAPPAEHRQFYTESLLVLPPSYQISIYNHRDDDDSEGRLAAHYIHTTKADLRRLHGLPTSEDAVVLCNFNKLSKIDLGTFSLWLKILSRIPRSYLWLLSPGKRSTSGSSNNSSSSDEEYDPSTTAGMKTGRSALIDAMATWGIRPHRVIFARRVSKEEHISRHAAGDLFLDTLIYGAHSTATDALRGGLPVLTVCGDSFPNRVAASLYASFLRPVFYTPFDGPEAADLYERMHHINGILVAANVKEMEDTAVRLLRHRTGTLSSMRLSLQRVVEGRTGIFDTPRAVHSFLRGMKAMYEAYVLQSRLSTSRRYNIVLADN